MNGVSSESAKPLSTEKHTTRKIKKTNAQKCKEYRERKKLKIVRVSKNSPQKFNRSEKDQLKIIKEPKSDAQRSREYRARRKLKNQEYKQKMKIRNQIIELNTLLTNYHSNVKMGDVQKQNQNGSESEKLDYQSEFHPSKVVFNQRIKEKMDKFEAS